ncbi:Rz1-like lysis system protein LysC [Pseudoalteromonas ruthenica]|uniref:Rz1-like lysis system protein LysC n=1 Tax=Pseudoalteromonas ruthenica TaxID=151081 RepID=UPI003D266D12
MKQIVLILTCLVALFGCSTTPTHQPKQKIIVQTKWKYLELDSWMVKITSHPTLNGSKWRDLSDLTVDYVQALNQCNLQVKAIQSKYERKSSTVEDSVSD